MLNFIFVLFSGFNFSAPNHEWKGYLVIKKQHIAALRFNTSDSDDAKNSYSNSYWSSEERNRSDKKSFLAAKKWLLMWCLKKRCTSFLLAKNYKHKTVWFWSCVGKRHLLIQIKEAKKKCVPKNVHLYLAQYIFINLETLPFC